MIESGVPLVEAKVCFLRAGAMTLETAATQDGQDFPSEIRGSGFNREKIRSGREL
jgi:hypothetical protein